MEKFKKNFDVILGVGLFVLFIVFTLIVRFVDLAPIGPLGSYVGLSELNGAFRDLVGSNMILYTITDWLGLVPFVIMFDFAIIGVVQLIKRKSLFKVDSEILALGVFYVLVACSYLFFEFVVINRRPILIDGILEASYPSSTTMLSIMVCISAIKSFSKIISNARVGVIVKIMLVAFTVFMVLCRVISGVHWITDIIAGIILSVSLLFIYLFLYRVFVGIKNNIS